MSDLPALLPILVLLLVIAAVVYVTTMAGGPSAAGDGRHRAEEPAAEGEPSGGSGVGVGSGGEGRRTAAIIVNPTKFDSLDPVKTTVNQVAADKGWNPPVFIETTEDDPGTGQAKQAVEDGADVVCPLGGDGTVRAVAAALVGTTTPLGLLPGGTGNLLARNLGLPIDDLAEAFRVCLDGADKRIDVGTLNVVIPSDTQDQPKDYYFLIMAGVGFDADVMNEAPEDLKAQVGALAYVVSGVKNLDGDRFGATIAIGDEEPMQRKIRSFLIGNCGKLQAGIELLPDAVIDDGQLDAVLIAPKGLAGWTSVAARVIAKSIESGDDSIESFQAPTMTVSLDEAQEVQLDGDPIGPGIVLTAAVLPRALTVRVIPGSPADKGVAGETIDLTRTPASTEAAGASSHPA